MPLVVAGLDADIARRSCRLRAASCAAAHGGRRLLSGATPSHLVNGGAIAVVMAKGDINLFGLGTVTEVRRHVYRLWSPDVRLGRCEHTGCDGDSLNDHRVARERLRDRSPGRVVGAMTGSAACDRWQAGSAPCHDSRAWTSVRRSRSGGHPDYRRLTPSLLASVTQQALRRRLGFEAAEPWVDRHPRDRRRKRAD